MEKKIYFCVDTESYDNCHGDYMGKRTYEDTENAINNSESLIVTLSLAHFSFDLIDMGYDLYLCYQDNVVKIEPHMDLSGIGEPCKDLRFGHNIFKMFKAGIFDNLIGYERK